MAVGLVRTNHDLSKSVFSVHLNVLFDSLSLNSKKKRYS